MTNWCSSMMVRVFRHGLSQRGELRTKFIKPVYLDETVHVRGRVAVEPTERRRAYVARRLVRGRERHQGDGRQRQGRGARRGLSRRGPAAMQRCNATSRLATCLRRARRAPGCGRASRLPGRRESSARTGFLRLLGRPPAVRAELAAGSARLSLARPACPRCHPGRCGVCASPRSLLRCRPSPLLLAAVGFKLVDAGLPARPALRVRPGAIPDPKIVVAVAASFGLHALFERVLQVPLPGASIEFLGDLGL